MAGCVHVCTRALREAGKRIGDDTLPPADPAASPLAWLDVTVPVDIEARAKEALADLAALRRLAPANAANAAAPARRPGPLAAFDALMSSALDRLLDQSGRRAREVFADGAAEQLDDRATER